MKDWKLSCRTVTRSWELKKNNCKTGCWSMNKPYSIMKMIGKNCAKQSSQKRMTSYISSNSSNRQISCGIKKIKKNKNFKLSLSNSIGRQWSWRLLEGKLKRIEIIIRAKLKIIRQRLMSCNSLSRNSKLKSKLSIRDWTLWEM